MYIIFNQIIINKHYKYISYEWLFKLKWLYLLTMIIPTLLGMFTTLVILSIVIGPPTAIFTPPIPAELFIENWVVNRSGRDVFVIIRVRNPGDEGLYIQRIYADEKEVVSRRIYIDPKSDIREISFVLPRRIGSVVNIKIVWNPETSGEEKTTIITVSLT